MNMMNDVLSDYLDDFVLVFLDDILVYCRIVEIHSAEHLGTVLEALRQHRLYAKALKCSIMEEKRSSSLDSGSCHKGLFL